LNNYNSSIPALIPGALKQYTAFKDHILQIEAHRDPLLGLELNCLVTQPRDSMHVKSLPAARNASRTREYPGRKVAQEKVDAVLLQV
jgi:hypothetical protein